MQTPWRTAAASLGNRSRSMSKTSISGEAMHSPCSPGREGCRAPKRCDCRSAVRSAERSGPGRTRNAADVRRIEPMLRALGFRHHPTHPGAGLCQAAGSHAGPLLRRAAPKRTPSLPRCSLSWWSKPASPSQAGYGALSPQQRRDRCRLRRPASIGGPRAPLERRL